MNEFERQQPVAGVDAGPTKDEVGKGITCNKLDLNVGRFKCYI